jgi:hypothetical protein
LALPRHQTGEANRSAATKPAKRIRNQALEQDHCDKRDDDKRMNDNQNLLHGGVSEPSLIL